MDTANRLITPLAGNSLRLECLPLELQEKIISFLFLHERQAIAAISRYWQRIAFRNCQKIVFIDEAKYRRHFESVKILYKNYKCFQVSSWTHLRKSLIAVTEVCQLSGLAIFKCKFPDAKENAAGSRAWQRIGKRLSRLTSLSLRNTDMDVCVVKHIVSDISNLQSIEVLQYISRQAEQRAIVVSILENNAKTITSLKISDIFNKYETIPNISAMNALYADFRYKSALQLWQSLPSSLNISAPARFVNLEELQLSWIEPDYIKNLGGEEVFPNLKVLSFCALGSAAAVAEEFPCIFNQNASLEALNVYLPVRQRDSGYRIANRYRKLKFLQFGFCCTLSEKTITAIASLKHLESLVWLDNFNTLYRNENLVAADDLLARVLNTLDNLQFLSLNYSRLSEYPETSAALQSIQLRRQSSEKLIVEAWDLGNLQHNEQIQSIRESAAKYVLSSWRKRGGFLPM